MSIAPDTFSQQGCCAPDGAAPARGLRSAAVASPRLRITVSPEPTAPAATYASSRTAALSAPAATPREPALPIEAATVDTLPASLAPDDHALMRAVRDGDLARLGLLFERHHRPLYGFFVRLTGQASASEDLVQTVFLRILKYRHTYRDDGKFTTWMYHLARRVAADHYRKSASAPVLLDEPESIHEVADHTPAADEQTARADDLDCMQRALARLPAEQRELLTLHRFQRLRHDELAELYGCSIGAMKVRVHRAVASLRDAFFALRGESRA